MNYLSLDANLPKTFLWALASLFFTSLASGSALWEIRFRGTLTELRAARSQTEAEDTLRIQLGENPEIFFRFLSGIPQGEIARLPNPSRKALLQGIRCPLVDTVGATRAFLNAKTEESMAAAIDFYLPNLKRRQEFLLTVSLKDLLRRPDLLRWLSLTPNDTHLLERRLGLIEDSDGLTQEFRWIAETQLKLLRLSQLLTESSYFYSREGACDLLKKLGWNAMRSVPSLLVSGPSGGVELGLTSLKNLCQMSSRMTQGNAALDDFANVLESRPRHLSWDQNTLNIIEAVVADTAHWLRVSNRRRQHSNNVSRVAVAFLAGIETGSEGLDENQIRSVLNQLDDLLTLLELELTQEIVRAQSRLLSDVNHVDEVYYDETRRLIAERSRQRFEVQLALQSCLDVTAKP